MYHHQHEVVAVLTLWRHFVRRSVDFSALPYRLLQGKAHSNATLLMAVVPCALGMAHVVWGAGGGIDSAVAVSPPPTSAPRGWAVALPRGSVERQWGWVVVRRLVRVWWHLGCWRD